jgi:predicted nucleic-acid-binding protein
MRAVDTNVLVRALVQDDPAQALRARKMLAGTSIFIPVTVILELEWVLRSRYGYAPKAVAQALEMLASLENAVVGEHAAVVAAAQRVRHGWDFADALHHALSAGCEDFATFDAALARRARRDSSLEPPVHAV